jgi:DNA-binding SARP family transcriptional activator
MFEALRATRGEIKIVHFATQKTALLLAILALPPLRQHPREELIDILWPDSDIESGRDSLNQALSWLRRQFASNQNKQTSILQSDRRTIALNSSEIVSDVALFENALSRFRKNDLIDMKKEALKEAIALYTGDFLPTFYDDWTLANRRRLQEDYLFALEQLARHAENANNPDEAIGYLKRYLIADPLNEDIHHNLIRILATSGQYAAALKQYEELKRILQKELQTTPSQSTQDLLNHIRSKSSTSTSFAYQINFPPLPTPLTRFFWQRSRNQADL